MKEILKRTDVWFKIFLFFFFIFLYVMSIPYPQKSRQFPQLLAVVSLIFIVVSLFIDFTRKEAAQVIADVDDTELKVFDAETKKARKRRFYQAWAIILVSTAIGLLGGFLFTTFFLFAGFALVFGKRTKKAIVKNTVITIGMTILIYIIFQEIMMVPLLSGIFG